MRFDIVYLWSKFCKKIRGKAVYGSRIHPTAKICAGSHIVNSEFGKYSYCGYDCQIINCTIGNFCSLADNVFIGGARHPIEWISTSPVFYSEGSCISHKFSNFSLPKAKEVFIGHDVWIGGKAIILPGVHIGTGAVVGAGAVVTKDVQPYEIVAGNPARVIRKRFDDQTIDKLLITKWWDLSENQLYEMSNYIQDPSVFLSKIKE